VGNLVIVLSDHGFQVVFLLLFLQDLGLLLLDFSLVLFLQLEGLHDFLFFLALQLTDESTLLLGTAQSILSLFGFSDFS